MASEEKRFDSNGNSVRFLDPRLNRLKKRKLLTRVQNRLEKAAADPEALSQDAIIQNLDPKEWQRLSKVRNIGIAVCPTAEIDIGFPLAIF
jgi:hypothetical protein